MNSPIAPTRAPVRPRTVSAETAESVLLEDAVGAAVEGAASGLVWIVGGPGAGKTVALGHLRAVLPGADAIEFVDARRRDRAFEQSLRNVVIVATVLPETPPLGIPVLATFGLARWGADEWIEYLLACHPARCASVMQRLAGARNLSLLSGLPELWRVVLDAMAEDEAIVTVCQALSRAIESRLATDDERASLAACVLELLLVNKAADETVDELARRGYEHDVRRLVRHRAAQLLLAAEAVLRAVRRPEPLEFLRHKLPTQLLRPIAAWLDTCGRARLESVLEEDEPSRHAMAASLLFAADPSWVPPRRRAVHLAGGCFANARWAEIQVPDASLFGANLASADLSHSDLCGANLGRASLPRARLCGAKLENAQFQRAELAGADLALCRATGASFAYANLAGACLERAVLRSVTLHRANLAAARLECAVLRSANLHRANLAGARLAKADLTGAVLNGVDLTGADLAGARCKYADFRWAKLLNVNVRGATFFEADFSRCSLESMDLSEAVFYRACLEDALMTASHAPGVCFFGANLRRAGLADIDWPGADLRRADLRGSTFHLGSSRSGLVGSYLAGEGSRTGFYTDEFHEQEFKSPEEIRKANLCRADLREAEVDGVDFYLVDLRGARYTPAQADHFRQCGAILEERVRDG